MSPKRSVETKSSSVTSSSAAAAEGDDNSLRRSQRVKISHESSSSSTCVSETSPSDQFGIDELLWSRILSNHLHYDDTLRITGVNRFFYRNVAPLVTTLHIYPNTFSAQHFDHIGYVPCEICATQRNGSDDECSNEEDYSDEEEDYNSEGQDDYDSDDEEYEKQVPICEHILESGKKIDMIYFSRKAVGWRKLIDNPQRHANRVSTLRKMEASEMFRTGPTRRFQGVKIVHLHYCLTTPVLGEEGEDEGKVNARAMQMLVPFMESFPLLEMVSFGDFFVPDDVWKGNQATIFSEDCRRPVAQGFKGIDNTDIVRYGPHSGKYRGGPSNDPFTLFRNLVERIFSSIESGRLQGVIFEGLVDPKANQKSQLGCQLPVPGKFNVMIRDMLWEGYHRDGHFPAKQKFENETCHLCKNICRHFPLPDVMAMSVQSIVPVDEGGGDDDLMLIGALCVPLDERFEIINERLASMSLTYAEKAALILNALTKSSIWLPTTVGERLTPGSARRRRSVRMINYNRSLVEKIIELSKDLGLDLKKLSQEMLINAILGSAKNRYFTPRNGGQTYDQAKDVRKLISVGFDLDKTDFDVDPHPYIPDYCRLSGIC